MHDQVLKGQTRGDAFHIGGGENPPGAAVDDLEVLAW